MLTHTFIHPVLKSTYLVTGVGHCASPVPPIDFGLSKQYRDPSTHRHITCKKGLGVIGTANFASINSHLGLELGRRDDLESLIYILIYFLRGRLPWQGLRQAILESKRTFTTHAMFQGLPEEFRNALEYCCRLAFDDKLDYDYLRRSFNPLLSLEDSSSNFVF